MADRLQRSEGSSMTTDAESGAAAAAAAVSAARELEPLIVRMRDDTERDRRIPEPIVERLRDARLWRMMLGGELGGLDEPVPAALEVYEALAGAEASVGWNAWNSALPCLLSRYLDTAARDEIFGDPRDIYTSSTRPSGRAIVDGDGYRVEGRWSLVSGCELAQWLALMCIVEESGAPRMVAPGVPEMRFMCLRRGEYEILDTWHAGGMRGTGSHDVVVKGRRVPRAHGMSPGDPVSLAAPLGRLPIICTMAAGYGALALGVAQTGLETVVELARTKAGPDAGPRVSERPAVLAAIARGSAALDAARRHLHACAKEMWDASCAGTPTAEGIGTLWGAAFNAVDAARSTLEAMYAAGGATSVYTDCPLERAHRDMHAMARHVVGQAFWLEDAGRTRLGAPTAHPLYAV